MVWRSHDLCASPFGQSEAQASGSMVFLLVILGITLVADLLITIGEFVFLFFI
jgi:hypothetical protein